jgi:two-component system, NtrC family, sensor histidine kinase PilS
MDPLKRKLIWLVVSRAAIIGGLFVITILIGRESSFVWPVALLLLIVSALSLIYAIALRLGLSSSILIPLQLGNDVLLVTWLVYRTGDIQSPFNALYLVVIFAASLLSSRTGIFAITLLSITLSSLLCGAILADVFPRSDAAPPYATAAIPQLQFNFAFTVVATLLVSILSTVLSDRQRKSDLDLATATRHLADLRALNQRIIESMRSGLATADLAGTVTSFNKAAEEITGYAASEVIGRPLAEIFPEIEYMRAVEQHTAQVRAQPSSRSDAILNRPDGSVVHLGFSMAPLTAENGELRGLVLIFQDVTEILELEQEVRRQEKLAALGTMAAGLAHEIRNPLASMRGSIQVLAGEIDLDDDQSRLMEIILRESDRLNRTVTEFLSYARQNPPNYVEFDLKQSIADGVVLLRNSPEVRPGHQIVEEYPDSALPFVGDPNHIRQIFWNLARNGLQAMPGGGCLTVRLERLTPETLALTVEDNGVGIPAEQRETMFEPFSVSSSGGVGLGMAIVYRLVTEHGGRIEVESEAGAGTSVCVVLPAREQ